MTTTKAYDDLVEQKRIELRGHKHTQLTESECKQEIEAITGMPYNEFEQKAVCNNQDGPIVVNSPRTFGMSYGAQIVVTAPKKRGRPKGSVNKPKEPK